MYFVILHKKNVCIKEKGHVVFCHESMTTASQKCNNISQICNKSLVIVENTTDKSAALTEIELEHELKTIKILQATLRWVQLANKQ